MSRSISIVHSLHTLCLLLLLCLGGVAKASSPAGDSTLRVTNLRFCSQAGPGMLLQWDTVPGALGYRVQYKAAEPGPWTSIDLAGQQASYQLEGLLENQRYRWIVRAHCGGGQYSVASEHSSFVYTEAQCPVPTGLFANPIGANRTRISWVPRNDVWQYELRYRQASATTWTVLRKDPNRSWHLLTGLTSGTTYFWQVRSICQNGDCPGQWSIGVSFTTGTPCSCGGESPRPPIVLPNPNNGAFALRMGCWREPHLVTIHNAVGVEVYRGQINNEPSSCFAHFEVDGLQDGFYVLYIHDGRYGLSNVPFMVHNSPHLR